MCPPDTAISITIHLTAFDVTQVNYTLHGAVLHDSNTASSGHYSAVVRHGSSWLNCSDLSVTSVNCFEEVSASATAYMCLYAQGGNYIHQVTCYSCCLCFCSVCVL